MRTWCPCAECFRRAECAGGGEYHRWMEINLLVISVGNTRTAVGAFAGGELTLVERVENTDLAGIGAAVGRVWAALKDGQDPAVAGASVNPGQARHIDRIVADLIKQDVLWVRSGNSDDSEEGDGIPLPIRVLTEQPEQTGVDRVLNVAAAYEQIGKACCVVDAGTAVTVSFCNDKGEFLGGAIAPGVRLQLGALHDKTAKLPETTLIAPSGLFGRSTTDAMHHGVYYGIRGMVKELIENFATHLGTWPEMIATGGDAELLFGGWELAHAVSPDLTLYGVALAYTEMESERV